MNRVGKYAIEKDIDETKLLLMALELPEKDKMLSGQRDICNC